MIWFTVLVYQALFTTNAWIFVLLFQKCIAHTMDRYFDATGLIEKTMINRIMKEQGSGSPFWSSFRNKNWNIDHVCIYRVGCTGNVKLSVWGAKTNIQDFKERLCFT